MIEAWFVQANGYTITTRLAGREWRYTEWVPFDQKASTAWQRPDYNPARFDLVSRWCNGQQFPGFPDAHPDAQQYCLGARELYDHTNDPDENHNVVDHIELSGIQQQLSAQLRVGWRGAMAGGH